MAKFAKDTSVPVERSMEEIRSVLRRYEAQSFISGEIDGCVVVMFEVHQRRIKFTIPLPDRHDDEFEITVGNQYGRRGSGEYSQARYEQAIKQRYRALLLSIKAKLESVESGIETFEEAFMAQLVLPDGRTMSEWAVPQIEAAYRDGNMPPLLGSGS